ncbi:MAG: GTP-binding protein [Gammaproteobacteria bacterium]|nr:GTP-binding protein [Gammaproteobacteria bacterium]
MSDLRINLLFGFLGSGKTTLVRRILGERGGERPMAVIVNEFGEVGVDGDVIAGNSVNLVELTSGCLCCTLRGSLMSAVEELREKAAVEQIVVEATGVASPGDMLEDLNDSKIAHEIDVGPLVTVVDAPKFTRLQQMLGEFYEEQVENADVLVLNKIDLATPEELDQAKAAVREINPDATLLFAEQGDTDLALLLDGPESVLLAQMQAEADGHGHHRHDHGGDHDPGLAHHADDHHHHEHGHAHAHAPAESFVMNASGDFSHAGLADAFASMPDNVWRSKGFLTVDGEPSLLQFTMGQLEIESAPARERPYLVVIGEELDRRVVEDAVLTARRTASE